MGDQEARIRIKLEDEDVERDLDDLDDKVQEARSQRLGLDRDDQAKADKLRRRPDSSNKEGKRKGRFAPLIAVGGLAGLAVLAKTVGEIVDTAGPIISEVLGRSAGAIADVLPQGGIRLPAVIPGGDPIEILPPREQIRALVQEETKKSIDGAIDEVQKALASATAVFQTIGQGKQIAGAIGAAGQAVDISSLGTMMLAMLQVNQVQAKFERDMGEVLTSSGAGAVIDSIFSKKTKPQLRKSMIQGAR